MACAWRQCNRLRNLLRQSNQNNQRPNRSLCRAVPPMPPAFTDLMPITPMVLLIGNYLLDRQHSMQRFGMMMLTGLTNAGVAVELLAPQAFLGKFCNGRGFIAKWLAYID